MPPSTDFHLMTNLMPPRELSEEMETYEGTIRDTVGKPEHDYDDALTLAGYLDGAATDPNGDAGLHYIVLSCLTAFVLTHRRDYLMRRLARSPSVTAIIDNHVGELDLTRTLTGCQPYYAEATAEAMNAF